MLKIAIYFGGECAAKLWSDYFYASKGRWKNWFGVILRNDEVFNDGF
jgi:hypothetical protein